MFWILTPFRYISFIRYLYSDISLITLSNNSIFLSTSYEHLNINFPINYVFKKQSKIYLCLCFCSVYLCWFSPDNSALGITIQTSLKKRLNYCDKGEKKCMKTNINQYHSKLYSPSLFVLVSFQKGRQLRLKLAKAFLRIQ